ncbi:MAG: biotin transporter BioY [Gemmatimonadota bacterium]
MPLQTGRWTEARTAHQALGVIAAVALIAGAARVAIPLPGTPVPVTLQPIAVLLVGGLLGAVPGAFALLAYLTLGALGAPVFSGGGAGLPWLLGPTGGYLAAFPVAAFAVGALLGRTPGLVRASLGTAAGLVVILTGGVAQLALVSGQGLEGAFRMGALPFLPGGAVQVALAVLLLRVIGGDPARRA